MVSPSACAGWARSPSLASSVYAKSFVPIMPRQPDHCVGHGTDVLSAKSPPLLLPRVGVVDTLSHSLPRYMRARAFQTGFGPQTMSERPSSAAYTFDRASTGRDRYAKAYDGAVVDPLWRGEAFNIHHIPSTPKPSSYKQPGSLGTQQLSPRRSSPSHAFSKTGRWAHVERAAKHRVTPGPGAYVN